MNIILKRLEPEFTPETGGAYAVPSLEIGVDLSLPARTQRALVIHEVLESYFPSVEHSKIEECVDLIREALDQLEALGDVV